MSSLDRILPFLKPIEDLLCDPTVTEVMVNGGGARVFIERDGRLEVVCGRTLEPRNLTVAIKNIARACGDEISDMQPILDARLEDGSRVAAMFPPCAVAGPALTIRKFTRRYSLSDLVEVHALSAATAAALTGAVETQRNVSGPAHRGSHLRERVAQRRRIVPTGASRASRGTASCRAGEATAAHVRDRAPMLRRHRESQDRRDRAVARAAGGMRHHSQSRSAGSRCPDAGRGPRARARTGQSRGHVDGSGRAPPPRRRSRRAGTRSWTPILAHSRRDQVLE